MCQRSISLYIYFKQMIKKNNERSDECFSRNLQLLVLKRINFKIFPLCNLYYTLNTGLKYHKTLPLLLGKIANHNGLSYQIHLDLHN